MIHTSLAIENDSIAVLPTITGDVGSATPNPMAVEMGHESRLIGANIEHAGRHNARVVLHAVRVHGPITRAALAKITGLTPATVTNITNRQLKNGLLLCAGKHRGSRGQPAARLVVNADGGFSLGIGIDRDRLTMVVVDFSGKVRARIGLGIPHATPERVHHLYCNTVDDLLQQAGLMQSAVTGIGVALPDDLGGVDLPGCPANHDSWSSVDIAALFAGPITVPIFTENDAAAAAMGEIQFGLGHRYANFFYLFVSVGLGGGVVIDSVYDRGADGRSGEIGFMTVRNAAGALSQLQTIVSLAGLRQMFDDAGIGSVDLFAAEPSDPAIALAIQNWIESSALALVEPLVAVNCLLNPEAILIGGRLPVAIVERLADRTNALLSLHGRNAPILAPIRAAALAQDAAAVGAALLPFGRQLLPSIEINL